MAPSVKDILKQSGLTDEQITAMDAAVLKGFETVVSAAAALEADAAEKQRLMNATYENDIVPALNTWGTEKATLEAERDFYRTQAKGAQSAGFIAKEAPGFTPTTPKDPATGQFVAGANPVPGSPAFNPAQMIEGISNATWYVNEHMRLYGTPPADDFEKLIKESADSRRPFKEYVEIKYKFGEKRAAITAEAQKKHDEKIAADATAIADKKWAERTGNNPAVRQGVESQYDKIQAATKTGAVKDPLLMSREERRRQTTGLVQRDVAENLTGTGTVN